MVDQANGLSDPSLPLVSFVLVIILILHLTTLRTMDAPNKIPVYISGLVLCILALSMPGTRTSGRNGSSHRINTNNLLIPCRLGRLLLALDAVLLAGVHLFYLKDFDFYRDADKMHFLGFWVTVALGALLSMFLSLSCNCENRSRLSA